MVGGRGGIRFRGKNEKDERKTEKITLKNGENASFWVINFAPPAANLFVGEKN